MQVAHQALQALFHHMGIDLRGRDIGVAEQRLHDAQIGAVVQKVAGEGVAQHVRRDQPRRQARAGCEFFQVAREMLSRQMTAFAEGRKQPFRGGGVFLLLRLQRFHRGEVIGHRLPRRLVQWHQPFLVALAAHHDHAGVAPRRRQRQRHQFGDAQAGGVEHFEQAIEPQRAEPLRR
jgi:hypothetical protein